MSLRNSFNKTLATILSAVALLSASGYAEAMTPESPIQVEYYPGTLLIQLLQSGTPTNYVAKTTSHTGCGTETALGSGTLPAAAMDTIKIWQSLAQAAQLSGKKLHIYSTRCGTTANPYNVITVIDLQN